MKKKVLLVDQGEFVGGAERFLIDFINSLSPAEIKELDLTLLGGESTEYKKLLTSNLKIKEFYFPSVRGGKLKKILASFNLLRSAKKMQDIIKTEDFTHVYTNTPRTHFVVFLLKKFFNKNIKWSVMWHDFTTPPTLVKQISQQANVLIVNSLPTRNFLRKNIEKTALKKIKIIENGINFSQIPKASEPFVIENILSLGRIDPRKGQLHILEAADLLFERNPNLKFSIVGNAVKNDKFTEDYQKELTIFAKNRNLTNTKFFSAVNNPFEEISKHDLIVFSSIEPETFGRTVVEALALGKMVISFDITGPREILLNFTQYLNNKGVNITADFFLVEVANSMSLAEKLGFLNDNPDLISEITKFSGNFVQENYNLKETKKRLLENFRTS